MRPSYAEAYSNPTQTFKIELFEKKVLKNSLFSGNNSS